MKPDVLADLALEFGSKLFTSAHVAALLGQHVQAVGNALGRVVRSGTVIAAPAGPVVLRRARTTQGRLSLWQFEPLAAADVEL